jgi:dolichol-phosphate mannosyltransferase
VETDCPKFALVVPTLNEAAKIEPLLERLVAAMSPSSVAWEILVVDDKSSDGTIDTVNRFAESESRVRLLVRGGQRGLAGAITYGWAHTEADLLGVIDADLQHPPELLPALISKVMDGCDIAIASRYVQAHSIDGWSPLRAAISRMSLLASKSVQKPALEVKDPMSGFFVLQRKCISGLDFQSTGFKLLLEILARGHIRSMTEIPFKFAPRQQGKSKANLMTAVHYISLLWRLTFKSQADFDDPHDCESCW